MWITWVSWCAAVSLRLQLGKARFWRRRLERLWTTKRSVIQALFIHRAFSIHNEENQDNDVLEDWSARNINGLVHSSENDEGIFADKAAIRVYSTRGDEGISSVYAKIVSCTSVLEYVNSLNFSHATSDLDYQLVNALP